MPKSIGEMEDEHHMSSSDKAAKELEAQMQHDLNNALSIEQGADHLLAEGVINKREWKQAQKSANKIRKDVAKRSKGKGGGSAYTMPNLSNTSGIGKFLE